MGSMTVETAQQIDEAETLRDFAIERGWRDGVDACTILIQHLEAGVRPPADIVRLVQRVYEAHQEQFWRNR